MLHIRKAEPQDMPALASLIRSLGLFTYLESESIEATAQRLKKRFARYDSPSHSLYMALDEKDHLAGYVGVHWMPTLFLPTDEGYINELFIDEAYRGQRAGTKLLAAVKEEGRQKGCKRLILENRRSRESYLRGFYKKDGWTERADMASFVFDL